MLHEAFYASRSEERSGAHLGVPPTGSEALGNGTITCTSYVFVPQFFLRGYKVCERDLDIPICHSVGGQYLSKELGVIR